MRQTLRHRGRRAKNSCGDTCEEVLGKKKAQHKEWISADTIQRFETRKERKTVLNTSRTRAAKSKAQAEYTAVDRAVKSSIR